MNKKGDSFLYLNATYTHKSNNKMIHPLIYNPFDDVDKYDKKSINVLIVFCLIFFFLFTFILSTKIHS